MSRKKNQKANQRKRNLKRYKKQHGQRSSGANDVELAKRLIARGAWGEALQLLTDPENRCPQQAPAIELLLNVYRHMNDFHSCCFLLRKLIELQPDEPENYLNLAKASLSAGKLVSSARAYETFVTRWPEHSMADHARQELERLKEPVQDAMKRYGFMEDQQGDLGQMHEEVISSAAAGDPAHAIHVGEELQQRAPDFIPVKNNLADAYLLVGQREKMLAATRDVLNRDPQNIDALANLARSLLLSGEREEAIEVKQRLIEQARSSVQNYCKTAEALTYFGDDEAVLRLFSEADEQGLTQQHTPELALLYHLAAVAAARQGNWGEARQHWKLALQINPLTWTVNENLENMRLPLGKRNAPWAFPPIYWVNPKTLDLIKQLMEKLDQSKAPNAHKAAADDFALQYPEVVQLLPILIDRAEPELVKFAISLAELFHQPEIDAALRDFCLSARGSDEMRYRVATTLASRNFFTAAPVRMYLNGKWQDVIMMQIELHDQPFGGPLSPPAKRLDDNAAEAMQRSAPAKAEAALRKALEIEPDKAKLHYNLATSLYMQGQDEEADKVIHSIHQRWPDYPFGRLGMATIACRKNDFATAEAYLEPLQSKNRFHHAEFSGLCATLIQLYASQGKRELANTWLTLWKRAQPEHHQITAVEQFMRRRNMLVDQQLHVPT